MKSMPPGQIPSYFECVCINAESFSDQQLQYTIKNLSDLCYSVNGDILTINRPLMQSLHSAFSTLIANNSITAFGAWFGSACLLLLDPTSIKSRQLAFAINKDFLLYPSWNQFDYLRIPRYFLYPFTGASVSSYYHEQTLDQAADYILTFDSALYPKDQPGVHDNLAVLEKQILSLDDTAYHQHIRRSFQHGLESRDMYVSLLTGPIKFIANGFNVALLYNRRPVTGQTHHGAYPYAEIPLGAFKHLDGVVAPICVRHSPNYAHWTRDVIGRILLLKSMVSLDTIDYFVFDDVSTKFQVDWLNLLGIPPGKVISSRYYSYISCSSALCTSKIDKVESFTITRPLYQSIVRQVIPAEYAGPKRIYISRQNTAYRSVLNESEICALLHSYGFEIVQAEKLTVSEQMRIFSNASIIISCHSAGLINAMFTLENPTIVEFHHAKYCLHGSGLTMWHMAQSQGWKYYPLFCLPDRTANQSHFLSEQSSHDAKDEARTANIYVNIKQLKFILDEIIESHES